MVTDDLSVSPMSMMSVVGLLNEFDIKDLSVLEEKVLEFGINEALELLKASLLSKEALTAVFRLKQKRAKDEHSTNESVVLPQRAKDQHIANEFPVFPLGFCFWYCNNLSIKGSKLLPC
ncbi:hypothetical protein OIU77_015188 [Salix suchowensis]|uniref:Uncharacterized protein n=1 Tax=Salix suchowensis TaxID=1278906 RepID=A0ABQ8ZS51_9ROSI|nr:hypothetical protein OIU77_015188 [Salix suchowensis]